MAMSHLLFNIYNTFTTPGSLLESRGSQWREARLHAMLLGQACARCCCVYRSVKYVLEVYVYLI